MYTYCGIYIYCIYRYISPSHDGLRLDLMFFLPVYENNFLRPDHVLLRLILVMTHHWGMHIYGECVMNTLRVSSQSIGIQSSSLHHL
jgi:hypothetical protein